jgi:hypothetical protein
MSDKFEWIDRDRGVLTQRDREILLGEAGEELSENAINQRYYNIRNRVRNAILDFNLLARNLPVADYRQIFEPAYDWSRERRHLNEEGRTSTTPELSPFLRSWMALFEFYTYGMFAGGMRETRGLMRGLIEEGMESGFRTYQHDNLQTYREMDAALSLEYGNAVLWRNRMWNLRNDLSNDPSEAAEEILLLHRQGKIPYDVAVEWFNEFVHSPGANR